MIYSNYVWVADHLKSEITDLMVQEDDVIIGVYRLKDFLHVYLYIDMDENKVIHVDIIE